MTDQTANTAQRVAVERFYLRVNPITGASYMAPMTTPSDGHDYVRYSEHADLTAKLAEQAAEIERLKDANRRERDIFANHWSEQFDRSEAAERAREETCEEVDRLNAIINTPQADDFLRAVSTEAEHQRQRWGNDHDAGKTPADWFWLIGYLAGKALHANAAGDVTKAEHHVITTAAACANWHKAMRGETNMRPGIDPAAFLAANGPV